MEMHKSDSTRLNTYFREAILNNNCELEFVYGSHPKEKPITQTEFLRLLSSIRQKYKNISESSTLDMSIGDLKQYSDLRVSIHGLENIKKYCAKDVHVLLFIAVNLHKLENNNGWCVMKDNLMKFLGEMN